MTIFSFRRAVWAYYRVHARSELPWRKTKDPYSILVSEIMLQQTQVPRVAEKYHEFIEAFPRVQALADAPFSEVLRVWSGMGYNRRAKYLHEAARVIVAEHGGSIPSGTAELLKIPGIGPYTASAIRVFSYNEPDVLIETNVRAAYIHHFFSSRKKMLDSELMPHILRGAEGQDPSEWHAALMDYGTYIKKTHGNPSRKSAVYVRQTKFEGSLRQVRGAILRSLQTRTHTRKSLQGALPYESVRIRLALASLKKDALIRKAGPLWSL